MEATRLTIHTGSEQTDPLHTPQTHFGNSMGILKGPFQLI